MVIDVAKPQDLIDVPAHEGSAYTVLVTRDGRTPTLEERVAMARHAQDIHAAGRAAFRWNMGTAARSDGNRGPEPVAAPVAVAPAGFAALENADIGKLEDGINAAAEKANRVSESVACPSGREVDTMRRGDDTGGSCSNLPEHVKAAAPDSSAAAPISETPLERARRLAKERSAA